EPVVSPLDGEPATRLNFTERFECPDDGTVLPAPTPQLFSFNNPRGACPTCNGFGAVLEYDEALVVPYPERTLRDGAIDPWTKPRYEVKRRAVAKIARNEGIPFEVEWTNITEALRERLLHAKRTSRTDIFHILHGLEE